MAGQLDQSKMQLAVDLEIEMMADMYNRMTNACHRKCIPPRYRDPELTKGESVCIDRCVAKYMDIHDRIGKRLTTISQQDEDLIKRLNEQQLPVGNK